MNNHPRGDGVQLSHSCI